MKAKTFDAVEVRCRLQKEAEQKISHLSEKNNLIYYAKSLVI